MEFKVKLKTEDFCAIIGLHMNKQDISLRREKKISSAYLTSAYSIEPVYIKKSDYYKLSSTYIFFVNF